MSAGILELALGDPDAEDNPLSSQAILAADERGEPVPAARELLADLQLQSELVPAEHGGRFRRVQDLAALVRVLGRRDLTLVADSVAGGVLVGALVWGGTDRELADGLGRMLLDGCRVVAPWGHCATTVENGALSGLQHLVGDPVDAEAIFVRQDGRARLAPVDATISWSDPVRSAGLRGARLRTIRYDRTPMPHRPCDQTLSGAAAGRRITGTVFGSAALGALDGSLDLAARFAEERRLYGRRVQDLPSARAILTDAFTDLLIAQACLAVAARSLHTDPAQPLPQAVANHLVPQLITNAVQPLSLLLGARSYLRSGPYAMFGKHRRDLTALTRLHPGAAIAAADLLAAWRTAGPLGEAAFESDPVLPELDWRLPAEPSRYAGVEHAASEAVLAGRSTELSELLADLRAQRVRFIESDGQGGGRRGLDRAARLAAASYCVRLSVADDEKFATAATITAALRRLLGRPGRDEPELFDRLGGRLGAHRTFDLSDLSTGVASASPTANQNPGLSHVQQHN